MYPANWPRCPSCGNFALDGHITCGSVECNESGHRNARADAYAREAWEQCRRQFAERYHEENGTKP